MNPILLTGATGNLGSHILTQLCQLHVPVRALVRPGKSLSHPIQAIQAIQAIQGNITLPDWGIGSPCQFSRIIHCAADVSVEKPLSRLAPTNVGCLPWLLHALDHQIPVDFLSTLSVFASSNLSRPARCLPDPHLTNLPPTLTHFGGYAQSKMAAERFLIAHSRPTTPLRLIRPSLLVGFHPREFFHLFTTAITKLGCLPLPVEALPPEEVNFLPVSHAAQQIAALPPPEQLTVHHLANPTNHTLADRITQIIPHAPVNPRQFQSRLQTLSPLERTLVKNAFFKHQSPHYHSYDIFHSTGLTYF